MVVSVNFFFLYEIDSDMEVNSTLLITPELTNQIAQKRTVLYTNGKYMTCVFEKNVQSHSLSIALKSIILFLYIILIVK